MHVSGIPFTNCQPGAILIAVAHILRGTIWAPGDFQSYTLAQGFCHSPASPMSFEFWRRKVHHPFKLCSRLLHISLETIVYVYLEVEWISHRVCIVFHTQIPTLVTDALYIFTIGFPIPSDDVLNISSSRDNNPL